MSLLDLLQDETKQENGTVNGVAIGMVSNNQDPDGLGRVKVKYPWREDGQESDWTRIAVLAAGKDRGTVWLPEVGDEVLLAFDKGNVEHPYVLGSLFNGKDVPPEKNGDGKNDIKMIKTRSGHKVTFSEKQGKESVKIESQGGRVILLDDTAGSGQIVIDDGSGNKFTLQTAQNSLTIETGLSLKLKSQSIEIEAGASMTLKASGTLTIQGALVKIN
jgi:uncharacterized protein involved in type VI secretion and phage assembly